MIPMSEDMSLRAWRFLRYDFTKSHALTEIRVWTERSGYMSGLYPAHALPWNRPPKPVKRK